jgi:hypothetical protein
MDDAVALPNHQATVVAQIQGLRHRLDLSAALVAGKQDRWPAMRSEGRRTHTVLQGDEQVILRGPGFLRG